MVTLRLKHSSVPIVGDMVFAQKDAQEYLDDEEDVEDAIKDKPNFNEFSILPSIETKNRSLQLPEVTFVSEEDIANNKYKLSDIILPLPGFDFFYVIFLFKELIFNIHLIL